MQQLNQQDSVFLYSETPRTLMHVGSLHIYDPSTAPAPVTFDGILEHVRHRLPLARVLRRKVVRVPFDLDYPYWVEDEDFDLEYHVRNIALPRPGNWRQLWVQAARLHSHALDLQRPPWELYIIEGVDAVEGFAAGSFAMLIKVHHAAIDGIAGIELMNALNDLTPEGRPPPDDAWRSETPPSAASMLAMATANMALMPSRLLQLASRGLPDTMSSPWGDGGAPTPPKPPPTPLNARVTTNRVADAMRFDLATAKQIKAAVPGATVNDVVLAVVSGALRRYLGADDQLPDESMQAGVPVSMRTEEDAGLPGNKIGIMVVSLATDVGDPLERLRAIQRSTSVSKEVATAVEARSMAESAELFPGAMLGLAVRAVPQLGATGVTAMLGNVCITNVPGSQVPLYLCGARMEAYYGLGPVYDFAGPIHMVVSYLGKIHLAVTSCKELTADLPRYIAAMEASLAELVAATLPAAPTPPPATPRRRPARPAGSTTTRAAASKAGAAKAAASKASASKTSAPKASASKTSAPKASASKTSAPKASASKTSAPKASASRTSAPKASATKASASRTSAPKASATKASVPKASASKAKPAAAGEAAKPAAARASTTKARTTKPKPKAKATTAAKPSATTTARREGRA